MVQCSNTNKVESKNNSGQIDQMLVLEKKILSIQNNVKKKNEKLIFISLKLFMILNKYAT